MERVTFEQTMKEEWGKCGLLSNESDAWECLVDYNKLVQEYAIRFPNYTAKIYTVLTKPYNSTTRNHKIKRILIDCS